MKASDDGSAQLGGTTGLSHEHSAKRDFGRFKWLWVDQVVADRSLPAGALHVVCILASRFLNKETLEAWPAQATLSEALGVEERQVRNLIEALKSRGHLEVKRGGRGKSNRYRPVLLTGTLIADQKSSLTGNADADHKNSLTGNPASLDRQSDAVRPALPLPTNLYIEPCLEPAASSGRREAGPPSADGELSSDSVLHDPALRDELDAHPRAVEGEEIHHDKEGLCRVDNVLDDEVVVITADGRRGYLSDRGGAIPLSFAPFQSEDECPV